MKLEIRTPGELLNKAYALQAPGSDAEIAVVEGKK